MPASNRSVLTRRGFLRQSLHGALLVGAAPYAISRVTARPAPSERLTIGVIGTGKRGHTLLRGLFHFPQAQVVAVSDVETTRRGHARQMAEEHHGSQAGKADYKGCSEYVDYRQLIEHPDLDAVVIATPDHWHALPVLTAARAHKDIYCEKPLSLTIREARLMADVVRQSGIVFQTGSQQRSECGGRFHRACELVRNGRLGKIRTVHVGVGGPSRPCDLPKQPVPDDVDWDRWLGPAPARGYHVELCPRGVHNHYPAWRNYMEYSGGGMTDWGAHHFDIAQWGLGMDESGPVEIHPPNEKEFKTLTYRYDIGVEMFHGGADGVKFTGERGWIEVNRGHLKASDPKILEETIGDDEIHLYKATNQLGNWLECVVSRKRPICHEEIGCRSVTVCHLGNLAYWHKRSLRWDPKAFDFVGDAEASSWRDRPYRKPWQLA